MNETMSCFYCDLIASHDDAYERRPAAYNLGSPAPRCARHWRYVCAVCHSAAHFMSVAYCPERNAYYCGDCAAEREVVDGRFSAWEYYFRYRSPWTNAWHPALDRLEYERRHPHQTRSRPDPDPAVDTATHHASPPGDPQQRSVDLPLDDGRVQELWDKNADQWDAGFDIDGDEHRKYHTDEYTLAHFADVAGLEMADVGCGNGYLCRKLAAMGARVTGVELSEQMLAIARQHEAREQQGVRYLLASATRIPELADESFDGIIHNHLLTSVGDLGGALREAHRLLRPGGRLSAAISHPCFSCGPRQWIRPAPDSPRPEEATGFAVDSYFRIGPYVLDAWEGFTPVPYFHRTVSEYFRAFVSAGFVVDDFVEPCVSSRGMTELPPWRLRQAERIPFSCVFQVSKPGSR